ncbi:hypothetical protein SAMN04487765_3733 [Tenacibaculum sp. MAR_2010_89]|uniref:hypothetical protein n=1 Tax=Tenacibaculum sp. MAR_2010_89 TaxID=1250198 RepID=UPI00089AA351|nr:hypothetical protein [Tenacibaculum sp. MAR_2010_89]SEE67344.1 hypothetical protein SAMN04487765_3733 [Tenacibaculum sp. MAR_2010_89]
MKIILFNVFDTIFNFKKSKIFFCNKIFHSGFSILKLGLGFSFSAFFTAFA